MAGAGRRGDSRNAMLSDRCHRIAAPARPTAAAAAAAGGGGGRCRNVTHCRR